MRAAIYFTPPPDDPLTLVAARWLGRDAWSDRATREPDPALDPLVAEPARYGFHATIRAPFRLWDGATLDDVSTALRRVASGLRPFTLSSLKLARLESFLALVPGEAPFELAELEKTVLAAFEPFRAPLTPDEVARRRPDDLSPRQRANLDRWGYPHANEDFRFHMTLSGSLSPADLDGTQARLLAHLGRLDGAPRWIDSLCLFVEPSPGAPFVVRECVTFGG